jgi:hypothetical protein
MDDEKKKIKVKLDLGNECTKDNERSVPEMKWDAM